MPESTPRTTLVTTKSALREHRVAMDGTVAAVLMTSSLYLLSVVFFGAVAERDTLKGQALFTAEVALPKEVVQAGSFVAVFGDTPTSPLSPALPGEEL